MRFQSGCYARRPSVCPLALFPKEVTQRSEYTDAVDVGEMRLTVWLRSPNALRPVAHCYRCAALFRNCGLRIGRERRVSDRAAQKIEGLFERAIVLFVGRHVGLRA